MLCPTFATPWSLVCQIPLSMGLSSMHTGVFTIFFSRGIFLTPRSNPRLQLGKPTGKPLYCDHRRLFLTSLPLHMQVLLLLPTSLETPTHPSKPNSGLFLWAASSQDSPASVSHWMLHWYGIQYYCVWLHYSETHFPLSFWRKGRTLY